MTSNSVSNTPMLDHIKELVGTRDLLWAWTGRNLRARYQQSILGWLWAIVQPGAQAIIFTVVFTFFVRVQTGGTPYILFSYVAIVFWTFFSLSLSDMTGSLVANMNLVTKIYFPRELLPMAAMLARLADLGIALLLLVALMVYYNCFVLSVAWLCLPGILALQILLTTGLGFACAAANVFYRDVQAALALGVQLWFYASPIIYPVTVVPESMRTFYFLNPMTGIIEAYREVLLYGRAPGSYLATSAAISLLVFVVGYHLFKRIEFQISDVI